MAVLPTSRSESDVYKAYVKYSHGREAFPLYLAAVAALSDAVSVSRQPLTTLSESLALVATLSDELKGSIAIAEAIAVSAGTDALQKLLVATLSTSGSDVRSQTSLSSVADTKRAITETATSQIKEAISAPEAISAYGSRIIVPGSTVVVPAYSRLIEKLLRSAAEAKIEFQVLFVLNSQDPSNATQQHLELIDYLQDHKIGTRSVALESITNILQASPSQSKYSTLKFGLSQTFVLAGAATLLASGAALVPYSAQITATTARANNIPVFIAAETTKCVKELGIAWRESAGCQAKSVGEDRLLKLTGSEPAETHLGVVPSDSITVFLTEEGPRNPTAIAEIALGQWS